MREGSLAGAVREARAGELSDLIDLTVANPTVCGFQYDEAAVLGALADARAMVYEADPRGLRSGREAVAAYYGGAGVNPDAVVLTTSTSEAYGFLFRLLCDAGDEVLVAQPGYPLFDFLGDLNDLCVVNYPLFYDFGWWIDFAELERRITGRTRAVLLVHPNNPTGHATSAAERERLQEICARHGLALIVDEVFLDYGLDGKVESFAVGDHPCLTFVVSGLSKVAALPQMKVGWLVGFGPEAIRAEAMRRLEVIADTFLSMNAPVQLALPQWLEGRHRMQAQIVERVRGNLKLLGRLVGKEVLPVQAGWCAVIRVARSFGPELAERLVREAAVVVHPGTFYGFAGDRVLVVSLLVPQKTLDAGVEKLNRWLNHASNKMSVPGACAG